MLKQRYGHTELRLHFEPYIYMLGAEGRRLTELAELIAISKQACNQTVDKLEQLEYVERVPDRADGRAKRVKLTQRGHQLVEDAVNTAMMLDQRAEELIGEQGLKELQGALIRLFAFAGVPKFKIPMNPQLLKTTNALLMLLPRLEQHASQHILQHLSNSGYEKVKPSHLELLNALGICNGSIKCIADMKGISTQAVSAQARGLEQLGFVVQQEPLGTKSHHLLLTEAGNQLLDTIIAANASLESRWQDCLGKQQYELFEQHLQKLCEALDLSAEVVGLKSRVDNLASQLREQLDPEEIQQLGQLLLASPVAQA